MRPRVKFRPDREIGLDIVIDKAPSLTAIARACGVSRPAVSGWRRVPKRHVMTIEIAFGVPRQEQRPDLFDE